MIDGQSDWMGWIELCGFRIIIDYVVIVGNDNEDDVDARLGVDENFWVDSRFEAV